MQLKEFLTDYQNDKQMLENHGLTCFAIPEKGVYPLVFASACIKRFKSDAYHIESLDVSVRTYHDSISQLQTSFLGMSLWYWIKGIDDIDLKYRTLLFDFLVDYQGPHRLIIFLDEKNSIRLKKNARLVYVPAKVDVSLLTGMMNFFQKKSSASLIKLVTQICNSADTIDIEQGCMIINYVHVIGRWDEAAAQSFERIIGSQQSLFSLSQHFFAKDSSAFYALWSRFESQYPMTFWTIFWSEQLWRAHYACYFLKQSNASLAKAVGYRLPFTFMQRDWKKTSLHELKNAHAFMYELDVASKNNSEVQVGIDLFYSKFFLNIFNAHDSAKHLKAYSIPASLEGVKKDLEK